MNYNYFLFAQTKCRFSRNLPMRHRDLYQVGWISSISRLLMSWLLTSSGHQRPRYWHDDVIKCKHFRVTGHLCGEFTGSRWIPGEFPTQRPVTWSFDVFFDLRPSKRLSKQWWGWWFETQSCPLWRHCNDHAKLGCPCLFASGSQQLATFSPRALHIVQATIAFSIITRGRLYWQRLSGTEHG